MQLGFLINADECMGCKVCEAACRDLHDTPPERTLRRVQTVEKGSWTVSDGVPVQHDVYAYSITMSCNHCAESLCAKVCRQHAIGKDAATGLVTIDLAACIGCGSCAKACPYHAIYVDERTQQAHKCDGCKDLVAAGEEPACVSSCLMRCLSFGDVEAHVKTGQADVWDSLVEDGVCAPPRKTQPSLVVVPHRRRVASMQCLQQRGGEQS